MFDISDIQEDGMQKRPNEKVKFTNMANTFIAKAKTLFANDDTKMRGNISELSEEELYELYITP